MSCSVGERVRAGIDLVVGQGVKHKRVVGIRAVSDVNHRFDLRHSFPMVFQGVLWVMRLAYFVRQTAASLPVFDCWGSAASSN